MGGAFEESSLMSTLPFHWLDKAPLIAKAASRNNGVNLHVPVCNMLLPVASDAMTLANSRSTLPNVAFDDYGKSVIEPRRNRSCRRVQKRGSPQFA